MSISSVGGVNEDKTWLQEKIEENQAKQDARSEDLLQFGYDTQVKLTELAETKTELTYNRVAEQRAQTNTKFLNNLFA